MDATNFKVGDEERRCLAEDCYHRVLELLPRKRNAEEHQEMINAAMAAVYLRSRCSDVSSEEMSLGYWQVSRLHSILGRGNEALFYAKLCQSYSRELDPYHRAYAFEAVARAAAILDRDEEYLEAYRVANQLAGEIDDEGQRRLLQEALDSFTSIVDWIPEDDGVPVTVAPTLDEAGRRTAELARARFQHHL